MLKVHAQFCHSFYDFLLLGKVTKFKGGCSCLVRFLPCNCYKVLKEDCS